MKGTFVANGYSAPDTDLLIRINPVIRIGSDDQPTVWGNGTVTVLTRPHSGVPWHRHHTKFAEDGELMVNTTVSVQVKLELSGATNPVIPWSIL